MNDNPRLPYGYEDNVTCTTDKTGRMAINWPEGCRGTVISRELLDAIVEEKNNCQRWIPVEERLPEERVKVLTCGDDPVEGPFILIGHREPASIFGPAHWHLPCFSEFGPVTHWMPLPSPPDEAT